VDNSRYAIFSGISLGMVLALFIELLLVSLGIIMIYIVILISIGFMIIGIVMFYKEGKENGFKDITTE